MGRLDEFNRSSSPVRKYLAWSSEANTFTYWNADTQTTESVPLPYKFVVLKEMNTVVGWSDSHSMPIYSNQVADIQKDELVVKIKNAGVIASGKYGAIKDTVKSAGGRYAKVIYVYDGKEIHAITFKGASMTALIDFTKEPENRDAMKMNFINVEGFTPMKKGKTEYSAPIFTKGEAITPEVSAEADTAYDSVLAYIASKKPSDDVVEEARDIFSPEIEASPFE